MGDEMSEHTEPITRGEFSQFLERYDKHEERVGKALDTLAHNDGIIFQRLWHVAGALIVFLLAVIGYLLTNGQPWAGV